MLKVQDFRELTGLEYLMADIACKHDKAYEKKGWDERLHHFSEIDFKDPKTFKDASNPIGLRAAYIALEDTAMGKDSGYTISLDAASSGLQLLSLLVSCPKSWKLCGGDEGILDAYMHIYMSLHMDTILDRKDVKQCIMTALYGSTAQPKAIFGESVDVFYEAMENMAPGAWDLNLGIQELWDEVDGTTYDWVLPDNFYCCIETHDKEMIPFTFLDQEFTVIQKVNERPRFHKGLGPNLIHSIDGMVVREMYRRCQYDLNMMERVMLLLMSDPAKMGTTGKSSQMVQTLWEHYQETGFLSVRILDYLYEDTCGLVDMNVIRALVSTMPLKPFELLSVHDCFRCHPNYGNDLRKQYNVIMADINDSTILPVMASQVANQKIQAKKVGHIPREVILNANYTLS
ncbi:N5 gp16-like protein [Roseovarius Plymouth podovirus 1]|uniref:N5 gp16-like protein n=2 Tax=Roseovarius Plymouth podovirus 1 TaxID=926474 RepID=K4Q4Y1_9CAUD|nr:RNA polymerase [Roseovarius Plymouth podovirus 1]CBW47009.1 N4 gp16-like protein [Roseovarius sp. 217 phage 1]CBX87946.1 N5 gp16-like protein [Roseovarius Plymouth podovirus 1]